MVFCGKYNKRLLQQVLKMLCISVASKYTNEFLEAFSYMHLQLRIQTQGLNTLRMGLLNCLNARSWDLTFRHCASCI